MPSTCAFPSTRCCPRWAILTIVLAVLVAAMSPVLTALMAWLSPYLEDLALFAFSLCWFLWWCGCLVLNLPFLLL